MDRLGHWVKPARRVTVPAVAFSVVVDELCLPVESDPDCAARVWKGCAAWVARRVKGRWQPPHELQTTEPAELWDWMHRHARRDARNYVVCPVASDVLTLSGFWREVQAAGCAWEPVKSKRRGSPEDGVTRFRRLVLKGVPDVIDFSRYGFRWVWLSLGQYLPLGLEEVAKGLSLPWIDTGRHDDSGTKGLRTPREIARVVLGAFENLTDWWGRHSKAPWGFTAGQLAMGVVRTHTQPKTLCTHGNTALHRQERAACFGGRASTWYVGDVGRPAEFDSFLSPAPAPSKYGSIPGPLHLVDVRSMYPHLLATHSFPRKLWSFARGRSPTELAQACKSYGCIAEVQIRTDRGEFPRRVGDRVAYPRGTFSTVLSAPEIVEASRSGKILEVGNVALYDQAQVFAGAAKELIEMRERARASGNYAEEFFAKLLGNSLGGKLAQRRGRWLERRKKVPVREWGEWCESAGPGKVPRQYRSVCGLVWEYVRDEAGGGPHTAAFATLCALGRLHMARIRKSCPMGSVVSQDTDGLWVTTEGLEAIKAAGFAFGDKAGQLRVARTVESARFYGPRHYWTPDGWILAGFSNPQVWVSGSSVDDTRTDNPVRRSTGEAPVGVFTRVRHSEFKLDCPGMVVDPDGWCSPRIVGQGN